MPALLTTLGKAIATGLNAETFNLAFSDATFGYLPVMTIPASKNLTVIVTDSGGTLLPGARDLLKNNDMMKVIIFNDVSSTSSTGFDPVKVDDNLILLEQIAAYLFQSKFNTYTQVGEIVRGDGEKEKSHFYPANLGESRVFAATLKVEYWTNQRPANRNP